ncbi:homoserine O-acetyltransferase [Pedobacter sp. BS3]|uniref:homoserine O-acetyltransferase family protein n=1 Tax=Pedobacter sp. BS3 TaxID=2567937 RepID=UPI0011EE3AFD|nr:homoserine O-acetyltransferase [Pedobacter sp. BS3]TZF84827.1 homoserine O-acetyltransferase [Pedobacter sp. BS3]
MSTLQSYTCKKRFKLENGKSISNLEIGYHTYGKLNSKKDNVIWVCHALTANSDVLDWWKGLFGSNDLFNPQDYYIVCANVLGSPYGTTNPLSVNPETGQPYYLSFPQISVRDMVAAHELLAEHLGISKISVLIGGSLGGQQALEWAIKQPEKIDRLIVLATNAYHSPWGIAFNESQRLAISADPTFDSQQSPDGGAKGLKAARSIALLSYRTYETYGISQQEVTADKTDNYKASSYQNYQGDKLVNRFNAYSYWYLSKAMDSHHVGRNRKSVEDALKQIQAQTLVIGIKTDLLFPPDEQKFIANHVRNGRYIEIDSLYGHDGFLVETKLLSKEIGNFLKTAPNNKDIVHLHKIA